MKAHPVEIIAIVLIRRTNAWIYYTTQPLAMTRKIWENDRRDLPVIFCLSF